MPKENTSDNQTQESSDTKEDFVLHFARAMNNSYTNSVFLNPIWQNELLKNINMNPVKYNRETVEKLISNPRANEKELRELAQYLENYIMQFNRLVNYYGTILTFDHYLEPTNADEDDMKSTTFKKSYKKALDWLDKFDVKKTLSDITKMVILEDAKFYYVRESENGITLQEMPSDYCKITHKNDLGYQYAFNMMYFNRVGVSLEDFAPEFREYYIDFLQNNDNGSNYFYWQELDPKKAVCFKFDENRAGQTPPLMGLFLDSVEIAAYKSLLKTKTQLDVWKIIYNKIPLHTESKGGTTKDNFALQADTVGKFQALMQSAMPEGVKVIASPLDAEAFDFNQSQTNNNIVGIGQQQFYDAAGTSPVLFGSDHQNGTGLQASQKTDESFVMHMYRVYERFINMQLKQVTGKYRFKIRFPNITIFNRSEKFEMYLKAGQFGFPKLLIACSMGLSPSETVNMSNLEKSLDLTSLLTPLASTHTQVNNQGRPSMSIEQLGDAGMKTRDNGSNDNR